MKTMAQINTRSLSLREQDARTRTASSLPPARMHVQTPLGADPGEKAAAPLPGLYLVYATVLIL